MNLQDLDFLVFLEHLDLQQNLEFLEPLVNLRHLEHLDLLENLEPQ